MDSEAIESFVKPFNLQSYEARIDALQKQVEEQSMTMSMYSSYSPEDFHQEDNDIFGKNSKILLKKT